MKPKTYAQIRGEKPFDWLRWLRNVRSNIGWDRMNIIRNLASDWPTCACGNQCAMIPRHKNCTFSYTMGQPVDEDLRVLGCNFYYTISDMQEAQENEDTQAFEIFRKRALDTFLKIEDRSTTILKSMGRKNYYAHK